MVEALPNVARKGRGALSNRSGRFEPEARALTDDGWGGGHALLEDRPATRLEVDRTRALIATNDSPDVPFARSINPYKGCEHGCIYCYARPSHAYLGLLPGLDFETRLFHKPDAPERLAEALAKPGYRPETIAVGANTDPYQPVERRTGLTRRILEVLAAHKHPFGIVTKSALVTRDLDLLAPLAADGLCQVGISITTLDADLARVLEPRASTPRKRLQAIAELSQAGVPVSLLVSPVIPGLTDSEIEAIVRAGAEAGATSANTILIRLPREIGPLFEEWLRAHRPARADRVLSLIRQCRGGQLYDTRWGARMSGSGPIAALIRQRFRAVCRTHGLSPRSLELDTSQFRVPPRAGDQLTLFE